MKDFRPPYAADPCRPRCRPMGQSMRVGIWVGWGMALRGVRIATWRSPEGLGWPRNAQGCSLASLSAPPLPHTLPALPLALGPRSGPLLQSAANRSWETFFRFRQNFCCHTRSNSLSWGCWLDAYFTALRGAALANQRPDVSANGSASSARFGVTGLHSPRSIIAVALPVPRPNPEV